MIPLLRNSLIICCPPAKKNYFLSSSLAQLFHKTSMKKKNDSSLRKKEKPLLSFLYICSQTNKKQCCQISSIQDCLSIMQLDATEEHRKEVTISLHQETRSKNTQSKKMMVEVQKPQSQRV